MTFCNTSLNIHPTKEAGFPQVKTLLFGNAACVSGPRQWCRTSRQHFADTVCNVHRAVPALLLSRKKVVRAEGLEPSSAF
jgi:hypothetical protein